MKASYKRPGTYTDSAVRRFSHLDRILRGRICLLLVLLPLLSISAASAESGVAALNKARKFYSKQMDSYKKEAKLQSDTLCLSYIETLDRLRKRFQHAGNLEGVQAVEKEKDYFADTLTISRKPEQDSPEALVELQKKWASQIARIERKKASQVQALTERYINHLEKLKVQLTKEGKIQEASLAKDEIQSVKESAEVLEAKNLLNVEEELSPSIPEKAAYSSRTEAKLSKIEVEKFGYRRGRYGFESAINGVAGILHNNGIELKLVGSERLTLRSVRYADNRKPRFDVDIDPPTDAGNLASYSSHANLADTTAMGVIKSICSVFCLGYSTTESGVVLREPDDPLATWSVQYVTAEDAGSSDFKTLKDYQDKTLRILGTVDGFGKSITGEEYFELVGGKRSVRVEVKDDPRCNREVSKMKKSFKRIRNSSSRSGHIKVEVTAAYESVLGSRLSFVEGRDILWTRKY